MIVQTKNSKVKGFQNESIASGKKFTSFLGIPYTKPPTDDLRFAPPVIMGADYLIEYDIVIVTFNYRLHILGFLDLQLPECGGNAGLKDQLMALKWVKENIKEVGGNPENITINESSAGGASVHNDDNFTINQSVIPESNFSRRPHSLCSLSVTRDPVRWAFETGRILGFTGDDRQDLLTFLK